MDPYPVDARLPLRRFVLFFADDVRGEAQELLDRLEHLGFAGRLYNDTDLLALEADEYRRTELVVRNSQYWFVYATESFFAEQGFLEQHRGELLARTAQGGHMANRLIPIFCKPKSEYRRLSWGFSAMSGLVCTDRYFEKAVTGLLKSELAQRVWQELQARWQQAWAALQAEEASRRKLEQEMAALKLRAATAAAAIAGADSASSAAESGSEADLERVRFGRPRLAEVTSSPLGPAQVIYNISMNANQSTLQIGDANISHYYSPSERSQIRPPSPAGATMEGLPYATGVESFSNNEADVNGDETTSCDPKGSSAAQGLSAQSSTGEPVSVVDSSMQVRGSGSTEMPSVDAQPAFRAISDDAITGGLGEQAEGATTTLAEEVIDRSMTESLTDPYTGIPNPDLLPTEGDARAIPVVRIEPYHIVQSYRRRLAIARDVLDGSRTSAQQVVQPTTAYAVNAAFSTVTPSEEVHPEGTAV